MGHIGWLFTIDNPGTGQKKILGMTLSSKIKGMSCPFYNSIKLHQGIFAMERGTGRSGGGVNDVREFTSGKTEIPNISNMKLDCRVGSEVWRLLLEGIVIPCKNKG